jgi:methionyl-tRNA formyltransferase
MNIIFMGTPDFSVPAFQELINSTEHNIVALFTQAPKAKGRGMKLTNSPVHNLAIENDIPVYVPKTLRNEEALELIKSINADIIIVVAYGFIIPKNILNAKKYGCLNIHPSKLPKYRGAAPLQRTIINGEKESAVCIMQMDSGLDTGDIILQENFKLSPHITLLELHDQCANIGAKLLIKTLDNIDNLPRIKQFEVGLSYAHKLYKEEGRVNWKESSFVIDCKIRGMNPWPGVYFEHAGKIIKILSSEYTENNYKLLPGELSNNFEVTCGKGTLIIKYLKPAGKSKMLATDYFRGLLISNNKIIFS